MALIPPVNFPSHVIPAFCLSPKLDDFDDRWLIPNQWILLHGADMPLECELEMPHGTSWTVGVTIVGRRCYFERGWNVFVNQTRIERSDTVVFTYHGRGKFKVMRFRTNGLMPMTDIHLEPEFAEQGYRTPDSQSDDSDDYNYSNYNDRPISALPAFTIVLLASDLESGPMLPVIWWKTNIRDDNLIQTVKLISSDSDPTYVYVLAEDEVVKVCRGWRWFARSKNLRVGDLCRFELIPVQETTLLVSINR